MRIAGHPQLSESFRRQAEVCQAMGAPFTARLCRLLGEHLDDTSQFGRRVLAWPLESLMPDLLPLRCCGALNFLVLSNRAPELSAYYPPQVRADDDGFWQAIAASIEVHDGELAAFLDSPPQTNEVTRSAVLLGGFLAISAQLGMPMALYELGASAGLNLIFDHYAYDLGKGRRWGRSDAPVQIVSAWSPAAPALDTAISIASRRAVDLRPVDGNSPEDRRRMLAYIWPEQRERVARIGAALDLFVQSGFVVEQGDALNWLAQRLTEQVPHGVCRVVFHSIFFQYLPKMVREQLRATIGRAGEAAPSASPLAWLAMEAADDGKTCQLTLMLWPGGKRHVLATVDWHGRSAEWSFAG